MNRSRAGWARLVALPAFAAALAACGGGSDPTPTAVLSASEASSGSPAS